MGDEKKPAPLAGGIFANALASASERRALEESRPMPGAVGAGMHNTLTCPKCGAARERTVNDDLTCRYCGTSLVTEK